jgi:signal peptidase
MKKILFNILKFSLISLSCILLGFSVYNCNSSRTTNDKMPMPFGFGMAVVVSGSMEPILSIDDLIFVKTSDEYKIDDLVVFQNKTELIVHRIISIDGDVIVTKGDANNSEDEPIKLSDIKGKVVGTIENIGWLIKILKSPIVVISVLGIAILLMEISFRKEKEEKNDKISKLKEEIRRLKE